MLVSIHQPHYLPWLRYFEKVARSDIFLLLDDVSFTRNGWQNRNRVKTDQGVRTLTVPVRGPLGCPLAEMEICAGNWPRKHWQTLRQSYSRASSFQPDLENLYEASWSRLGDLNRAMFTWHLEALGLRTPWSVSSAHSASGNASERLVELVRTVGGTAYLTGEHAFREYLDPGPFRKAGLALWVFGWTCPEYAQLHPRAGFVPDLALVDLLFSVGGDEARRVLRKGSQVSRYAG